MTEHVLEQHLWQHPPSVTLLDYRSQQIWDLLQTPTTPAFPHVHICCRSRSGWNSQKISVLFLHFRLQRILKDSAETLFWHLNVATPNTTELHTRWWLGIPIPDWEAVLRPHARCRTPLNYSLNAAFLWGKPPCLVLKVLFDGGEHSTKLVYLFLCLLTFSAKNVILFYPDWSRWNIQPAALLKLSNFCSFLGTYSQSSRQYVVFLWWDCTFRDLLIAMLFTEPQNHPFVTSWNHLQFCSSTLMRFTEKRQYWFRWLPSQGFQNRQQNVCSMCIPISTARNSKKGLTLHFWRTWLLWEGCSVSETDSAKPVDTIPSIGWCQNLSSVQKGVHQQWLQQKQSSQQNSVMPVTQGAVGGEGVITATSFVCFNIPSWYVPYPALLLSSSATVSPGPGCRVFKKVS